MGLLKNESTPANRLEELLRGRTITYGNILSLLQTVCVHSKEEDWDSIIKSIIPNGVKYKD